MGCWTDICTSNVRAHLDHRLKDLLLLMRDYAIITTWGKSVGVGNLVQGAVGKSQTIWNYITKFKIKKKDFGKQKLTKLTL